MIRYRQGRLDALLKFAGMMSEADIQRLFGNHEQRVNQVASVADRKQEEIASLRRARQLHGDVRNAGIHMNSETKAHAPGVGGVTGAAKTLSDQTGLLPAPGGTGTNTGVLPAPARPMPRITPAPAVPVNSSGLGNHFLSAAGTPPPRGSTGATMTGRAPTAPAGPAPLRSTPWTNPLIRRR